MELKWIAASIITVFPKVISVICIWTGCYFMNKMIKKGVPLEQQSLEELRTTMVKVLELSLTNLGERLPRGRTWEELAQEIHKGAESRELLIFLITELMKVQVENEVTQHALLILIKWDSPYGPDPERPWSFPGVE